MSESIYTWIKPDPVVPEKPPMHVSQAWRNPLPPTTLNIAAKKPHGTFGVELKGTVRPDQFVKAHEKSGFTNSSSIREWARTGTIPAERSRTSLSASTNLVSRVSSSPRPLSSPHPTPTPSYI